LDIAPKQDDRGLAKDPNENNNFFFEDNDDDKTNPHSRCPFSSHIRKTNPRSDLRPEVIKMERVLRRGIPYGPEVTPSERANNITEHDRGLLFVCYQSHIARGFELMQRRK
jgi:deferrochelatase/peroxidase EfeB